MAGTVLEWLPLLLLCFVIFILFYCSVEGALTHRLILFMAQVGNVTPLATSNYRFGIRFFISHIVSLMWHTAGFSEIPLGLCSKFPIPKGHGIFSREPFGHFS